MKYRKKPVVIEAKKFETNNEPDSKNMNDLVLWMNQGSNNCIAWHNGTDIYINTLEGTHKANCGDWIIKGIKGEFYPIKENIFLESYEKVEE